METGWGRGSVLDEKHSPADCSNEHVSTCELGVFLCVGCTLARLCQANPAAEGRDGGADHAARTGDLTKERVAVREPHDGGAVGDVVGHAGEDDDRACSKQ